MTINSIQENGSVRQTFSPLRISIVVPNYNGGKTIEASLRSIIDQNYPNLELIVMDGGSKDNSVDIIKKYAPHIAYWESERDRGQSHAINKGMARATGEVVNWLCSDDQLLPGTLAKIGRFFAENPDVDVYAGASLEEYVGEAARNRTIGPTAEGVLRLQLYNCVPQPSCFWRRRIMTRNPPLREDFHFKMDAEMFCLFQSQGAKWVVTDECFSRTVQDGNNKTMTADYRYYFDSDRIFRWYWKQGGTSPVPLWYRMSIRPLTIYLEKNPHGALGGIARWAIQQLGNMQRRWRRMTNRKIYRA